MAYFLEKRFSAQVTKIHNLGSNFWVQKLDLTINFSNWQPKTNFSGQNVEKSPIMAILQPFFVPQIYDFWKY